MKETNTMKIWEVLDTHPGLTAQQLAEETGIPLTGKWGGIYKLLHRGFDHTDERPMRWKNRESWVPVKKSLRVCGCCKFLRWSKGTRGEAIKVCTHPLGQCQEGERKESDPNEGKD